MSTGRGIGYGLGLLAWCGAQAIGALTTTQFANGVLAAAGVIIALDVIDLIRSAR